MLEELPKWGLLTEIMGEVSAERRRLAASEAEADRAAATAPVLIVAREIHTCAQLAKVRCREMLRSSFYDQMSGGKLARCRAPHMERMTGLSIAPCDIQEIVILLEFPRATPSLYWQSASERNDPAAVARLWLQSCC